MGISTATRVNARITRLKQILSQAIKAWKTRKYLVDCHILQAEIAEYLPIDAKQLSVWMEAYNRDPVANQFSHPYLQLAHICMRACLHDWCGMFYLRYLAIHPCRNIQALYLQSLMLNENSTNESLLEAHVAWAEHYNLPPAKQYKHHPKPKAPGEKIRIGYLCHFFDNSVGQNCLLPFLSLYDKNKFEVFCYDDGATDEKYHNNVDYWCNIRNLSDQEVANMIHADQIDILQELNGLCYINRFGALAYRPAPIQINWFNHTSTTGLPFVDYVMSDQTSIADSDLPFYVEKPYRTKSFIAAVQFDAEKYGELPVEPPCIKNNYVTFGYFGASHKFTPSTIQLWSQVLKSIPTAKLLLKCTSFSEEIYRTIIKQRFLDNDVPESQIIFDEGCPQAELLKKYHEIDLIMDTTTTTGGSTIFEALLQSIPVVTLAGHRWSMRSGASVLSTLNHPELIAHSPEEYVQKIVELANDTQRLKDYRKQLRQEMLNSSLTNMQQYNQHFEEAYLKMSEAYQSGAGYISQ